MKMSSYKIVLGVMATLYIALAIAVGYLLAGRNRISPSVMSSAAQTATGDPVIARGLSTANQGADQAKAGGVSEPALVPVQLSPQRMQEIGVTTAVAAMKALSTSFGRARGSRSNCSRA